jgi:hypothetical protein
MAANRHGDRPPDKGHEPLIPTSREDPKGEPAKLVEGFVAYQATKMIRSIR